MSGWRRDEPPRDGSACIGVYDDNSGVFLFFWGISKDGTEEQWIDGTGLWTDFIVGSRWVPAPEGTEFNMDYAR
jgi:hypothetical protein